MVKYNISTGKIETYSSLFIKEKGVPHDENVSDVLVEPVKNLKELSGKWITDILSDANGNLWLNINNNNIAFVKSNLKDISIYHVNSGNRLDVFSSSGFFYFNNSNIFLGGKNGIISFSPPAMKRNNWSPLPVISEFKIQNEEVFPEMEINGEIPLSKDLNYGNEIELSHKNRNFSLQFSAPSFANEKLNKFQYMLEGFDKEWITVNSTSRIVQYTNLYPGNYTFNQAIATVIGVKRFLIK